MFCWPSRRNTSSRKKSKSSDFSSAGDSESVTGTLALGSTGILVKPYKPRKKGKKSSATFKCDLSEALLPSSDECLLNSRSASCNSSIRDLNSYHQQHRGGTNKHFVSSSQHLSGSGRKEEVLNSLSVNSNNNNNRSAEVLLFYSNNSISTRNSLADFIENEEFNYKSLWGKDITEWDSRESRCSTLERPNSQANYYVKTGTAKSKSDTKTKNESAGTERLVSAASSPSLTVSVANPTSKRKPTTDTNFYVDDDDDEPLPSPPPTPPEAKNSSVVGTGTCAYFNFSTTSNTSTTTEGESPKHTPPSFRIHSSTSTSSLSSSCILTPTPEITEQKSPVVPESVSDCGTQTLPFWQLEFPGTLRCSCSHSSEDSGIVLHNSSIGGQLEESSSSGPDRVGVTDAPTSSSSIVCAHGHESPGGDSSSGISSSDDNLESLQADEEIMLKSLKNSFLHQAIPFQLCSFGSVCGSNRHGSSGGGCTCCKEKSSRGSGGGDTVITSIANNNASVHSIINNEFANSVVVTNSALIEKQKVHEHNLRNQQQQQQQQLKGKCELSIPETVSSVTSHQDRNRLGPVGKNYGSSGLDANANESDGSHLRGHGQSNGDLGKPCTKVGNTGDGSITAEPLIESSTLTKKAENNRVSSSNQQNIQNTLLTQENSLLKEEVSRLTSVVSDLQQQISQLVTSGEESRKCLANRLSNADKSCMVLAIVTQQSDKEKTRVYEELEKQRTENQNWKLRLDEKLSELHKLQEEFEEEREFHQEELRTLSSNHEIEVDVTVRNCENKLEQLQKRHDETLAELKRSHTDELERLQECQRQELDQTIQKHRELLDQHRNQSPHDILHKEVESLQVVLEMRNEEIRVLRKDLMDYKNTLNDLQTAREYGKSLLAKIEDLDAQLEKARSDKRSIQEKYQELEVNLQQVESENNRLVRCNEELTWKMKTHKLLEN